MGTTSPQDPFDRLRTEVERRGGAGYLLTVGDDGGPHCVAVEIGWRDDELVVHAGATSARNAGARPRVALLSPPAADGGAATTGPGLAGYSLIVDGETTAVSPSAGGATLVRVRPLAGVLHRPSASPDGGPLHDCVRVYDGAVPGA